MAVMADAMGLIFVGKKIQMRGYCAGKCPVTVRLLGWHVYVVLY